jgi:parallel beta-helix repeat protein
LNSSSNNTLTSNTGTSDTSYGFFITASHYNTFSNNTGSSNGDGGLQLELSNFNTFLNNTFFTYGGTTIEDLSVDRSYKNNTFRNTNWSTYRKLKFYIALDEFNQSQNSGITWVNTNVTTASIVNRSILNWEQTDIILDETWNGANTVRYTASGLLPNVYYSVMNYSTLTTWTEKLVATDANGLLPEQVINFSTTQKYVRFLFNESATFILAPIGAKTLSTSSKSFTISASCPLGCSGPIVYSTTATLGSIDSATGIYTINASQLTTGEFNWVFSATDGNYSDSETIHVSMNSMLTAGGYNTMQKTSGNTNKGLELASLVALVLAAMLIIGIVIGMGTGVIDGKTAIITITTIVMFGIVVLFMIIINDSIANL